MQMDEIAFGRDKAICDLSPGPKRARPGCDTGGKICLGSGDLEWQG